MDSLNDSQTMRQTATAGDKSEQTFLRPSSVRSPLKDVRGAEKRDQGRLFCLFSGGVIEFHDSTKVLSISGEGHIVNPLRKGAR
jgi:hypothetical protein